MARRNLPWGAIPMDAGERDRIITIQTCTDSEDGSGMPIETWTTLQGCAQIFASKNEPRGEEKYGPDQLSASSVTRWEMAYRADMDPDLVNVPKVRRVLYQGRVHDIIEASEIGRKEGVELITLAKVDKS